MVPAVRRPRRRRQMLPGDAVKSRIAFCLRAGKHFFRMTSPLLGAARRRWREAMVCLLLSLVTLAVYWPVREHEFVDFDDRLYLVSSPHVSSGLTLDGAVWALRSGYASNWHPLTWLSHMLDCQLYGLNPSGHHQTNLLFHLANTLLLFLVLKRMTQARWRSALVAALFAWHPLHVESVAWVAERKDLLCAFFWLLTMAAYARYVAHPRLCRYSLTLACFALGLMAKPMIVTLPFVLLLLDYWPLKRLALPPFLGGESRPGDAAATESHAKLSIGALVKEKVPFFLLAAAASTVTFLVQRETGAVASTETYPVTVRLANALISYWRYLGKMIWPDNLAVFYPHPMNWPPGLVLLAALGLVAVTALAFRAARHQPYFVVGWLWFLGTLVPVIGLVQVGAQAMADRYTYLPLIGLFVMIAWGAAEFTAHWRWRKIALPLLAGVALCACLVLTYTQVWHWRNTVTLFTHTAQVTTNNYPAQLNWGLGLEKRNDLRGAAEHYREALRMKPGLVKAVHNLARLLARQGKIEEGRAPYLDALRLTPNNAVMLSDYSSFLAEYGLVEEAITQYSEAVRLEPKRAQLHNNLGTVWSRIGRQSEAIGCFTEAIRLQPDFADAHNNLANALTVEGRNEEAILHMTEVIRLEPGMFQTQNNLGVALFRAGRMEEAAARYTAVLRIKPDYVEARSNLGVVLSKQGKHDEAAQQFAEAIRIAPDFVDAQTGLGMILVGSGKLEQGINHLARAAQLRPDSPQLHYQLGLALARQPKWSEAIQQFREAVRLQPNWSEALNRLALILATHTDAKYRDGAEAVRLSEHLCELAGRPNPVPLNTLAAAYAEVGRFAEAATVAQQAFDLAVAAGKTGLASQIQNRLKLYRAGLPAREIPQL